MLFILFLIWIEHNIILNFVFINKKYGQEVYNTKMYAWSSKI